MNKMCREVQAQLPRLAEREPAGWRLRLVRVHLRRCAACRDELDRQREVAAGLDELSSVAEQARQAPPDGLLDALLEQAERPGVRGRVAVPARGAVSGARPALSAVLLVTGAVAGTAVGYASWRGARALGRAGSRRR